MTAPARKPARARRRVVVTAADVWPEDDAVAPPDARVAALRRLLPANRRDIVEGRPDLWPDDRTGHKRLEKDLVRLGAVCLTTDRIWHLPERAQPVVDPRLVEPEKVDQARRFARRMQPVPWTLATAVLANLDNALAPRSGRSEGARLLEAWVRAQGLSVRRAAGLLQVSFQLLSYWTRGERRPRGPARQTIEAVTGVPAFQWDRPEQASTFDVDAQEAS